MEMTAVKWNRGVGRMCTSPMVPSLGWIFSFWIAPGHIQIEISTPLLSFVSFSSQLHLYTAAPPSDLWLLLKGCQNHTLTRGGATRGTAEWTVAFATTKSLNEKLWQKVITLPSSHGLWGKLWRTLSTRFHKCPQVYSCFLTELWSALELTAY